MKGIISFVKKEAVTIIAVLAACISALFAPVVNYSSYIDIEMIGLLFCMMSVVALFTENNVFKSLAAFLISKTDNTRKLTFTLVVTVFFISMLITNDVALIAFIPFTLMAYEKIGKSPVYCIVLQTVAANMGSAFTPFGNPQNLLLYSLSSMRPYTFFSLTAPVTLISFVVIIIMCFFEKKEMIDASDSAFTEDEPLSRKYLIMSNSLYAVLFILCILCVFDRFNLIYLIASICMVVLILQPVVLIRIDYGLLITFAAFFIFVGNLKKTPGVTEAVNSLISGRIFESSLIASQIISNVPSAVMISGFSDRYNEIILGTDIGGLGTVIASLASLITLKKYLGSKEPRVPHFMLVFTIVNVILLAVLVAYTKLFVL